MNGSRGDIFIDKYWLNQDSSYKEVNISEGGFDTVLDTAHGAKIGGHGSHGHTNFLYYGR